MLVQKTDRRKFIKAGGLIIAGVSIFTNKVAAGILPTGSAINFEVEKVSATEDLMREHGLLNRILLIYENIIWKISNGKDSSNDALNKSARIIKDFIENYHEKLEENYLFTRLEKAGKQTDLVKILKTQHDKGRILTEFIIGNSGGKVSKEKLNELSKKMASFIRMYRPHEAREDTILFPAFKKIVSQNEYDSLGEEFEKKEHDLFGEDGFEMMLGKVTNIEKTLGINDLSQFTPNI